MPGTLRNSILTSGGRSATWLIVSPQVIRTIPLAWSWEGCDNRTGRAIATAAMHDLCFMAFSSEQGGTILGGNYCLPARIVTQRENPFPIVPIAYFRLSCWREMAF